jgi:signal transduction histidine kinase
MLERRDWRTGTGANVALGVVMAMALAIDALRIGPGCAHRGFDFGVGLVICATALLRGRHLAWAAAAGLIVYAVAALAATLWNLPAGLFLGGAGALAGLLVLGAAAAQASPARPAVIIGIAGTFVVSASQIPQAPPSLDGRAFVVLAGATAWATALVIGTWLRYIDRRRRETMAAIRRGERLDLARELHDVVAHHVTGIVVQAQAARFAGSQDPGPLTFALSSIETAGTETLTAIRQLVGLLRDPDDGGGLASGPEPISQLVERFARHGPAVDLRLPAGLPDPGWPPEVASTAYRIVQEALTNINRHAPGARSVTVTVTHDSHQVGIEVTDDAPAASRRSRPGNGYGLMGMRERVEALGGKVSAGPRPGAGWAVRASLPATRKPVPAPGRP